MRMPGVDATRVVVLRHGQTAWNAGQRIQGHTDIPLDATGLWQAERLAEALAAEGITHIYSSDLARAHATAAALARRTGLAVQTDARLRERGFGAFEGLSYAEIGQRWPEDAERWRRREPAFQPGGGESLISFQIRCAAVATELAARHPGATLALVAHGGVLDMLYRLATGQALEAPRSWALGNATINRLLWTGEGFTLVGWNDDAHLAVDAPQTVADSP